MSGGPPPAPLRSAAAALAWAVVGAAALAVWLLQDSPALNRSVLASTSTLDPAAIKPDQGKAFVVGSRWFGFGDDVDRPRSGVSLLEDGAELPLRAAKHDEIRSQGGGRWSHWTTSVFFSSSDGSDPRGGTHRYQLRGLTLPVRWGAIVLAAVSGLMFLRSATRALRGAGGGTAGASGAARAEAVPGAGPGAGPGAAPAAGAAAPASPRKRLLMVSAMVVCTLLLLVACLAAVELLLRWSRSGDRVPELRFESALGWERYDPAPVPFGDVERLADPAAPPLRVLFMGDSFTHTKTWGRRTIDALRAAGTPAVGWECGVSGYGTLQEALLLERLLPALKPDVVVVLFYGWNDVRDNWRYPAICYNAQMTRRPYLNEDGSVSWPSGLMVWLKSLELWRQVVEPTLDPIRVQAGRDALATKGVDGIARERMPLVLGYDAPETWLPFYRRSAQEGPYVSGAWAATQQAFERLARTVRGSGASLVVAALDNPFCVDADVAAAVLPAGDADVDVDIPMRRWAAIMASMRIPAVDLIPALRARRDASAGAKQYDGGTGNFAGHLQPEAEQVIADGVTPLLRAVPARRSDVQNR